MLGLERTEQRFDLWSRQYDRETWRPLGPNHIIQPAEVLSKDVAVQKDQRTERLILRRGAHLLMDCEPRQERRDLCCRDRGWVNRIVKEDEPPDPTDVRLLGPGGR